MILTINLDHLDPTITTFYENNSNKLLIQDALIHGFKIVNSPTYALNFENSNQNNTHKIDELSNKNSLLLTQHVELESEIQKLKNKNLIDIGENSQKLTLHFNQQKNDLKNELENQNLKRETEKQALYENQYNHSIESMKTEIAYSKNKLSELQNYVDLQQIKIGQIKDQERDYYQKQINELQSKLDERNSIYSNSSKKGADGENKVENVLNDLFPSAIITNVHTQTRSGDMRIELNGIQILFENKNFNSNVPKRDIDKFIRDVQESDVHCGIMCSENTGIANRNDLDIEIIEGKPLIYLHNTKSNVDKIRVAILILVNILQNNLELDTSMIQKIKELIKESEELTKIYNSQKKSLNLMTEQNEKMVISNRTIKYRLEEIIYKCEDSTYDVRKQKCHFCSRSFTDLEKHISKNHSTQSH
jgi:hypothetical protein